MRKNLLSVLCALFLMIVMCASMSYGQLQPFYPRSPLYYPLVNPYYSPLFTRNAQILGGTTALLLSTLLTPTTTLPTTTIPITTIPTLLPTLAPAPVAPAPVLGTLTIAIALAGGGISIPGGTITPTLLTTPGALTLITLLQ